MGQNLIRFVLTRFKSKNYAVTVDMLHIIQLKTTVVFFWALEFWIATLLSIMLTATATAQSDIDAYFYTPATIGSDSIYNPLHAFFSYSLDTLQIPDNFGIDDFNDNVDDVVHQLRHPRSSIEREGGFTQFINREIFPVDFARRRDSLAALPNYSLHLLGGGLVFRRDLEWFRSRNYPYPRILATAWSMTAEILQEALETKTTIDSDPVADIYLFRPLGILMFSHDYFAQFIKKTLNPAIWPMLHTWNVGDQQFLNTGISYVYRPPALTLGDKQIFIYTGLTTLFGLSEQTANDNTFSWGIGAAMEKIERQRDLKVDIKPSMGLFYDHNNSLLWSMLINDAGNSRFRLNVYPSNRGWFSRAGWFLSINDERKIAIGLSLSFPVGIGLSQY